MSTFSERLNAKAKSVKNDSVWHPEEGEQLIGKIMKFGETVTASGDTKYVEITREDDGKIITVWCNKVLVNAFTKQAISEGDRIGIEYLGREQIKDSDKTFHNYAVLKDTGE